MIDGYDQHKNHQDDLREIEDLKEEITFLRGDNETLKTLNQNFAREILEVRKENLHRHKAIKDLKEEVEHLRKGIRDAIDLAGTHYYEWGERALMVFKVLEGMVEEEEDD